MITSAAPKTTSQCFVVDGSTSVRIYTRDCFDKTYPFQQFSSEQTDILLRGCFRDIQGNPVDVSTVAESVGNHGPDILRHIDGTFAIVMIDRRSGECWCAADPKAFFPIYYTLDHERLSITNDASLIGRLSNTRELDVQAVFAILNSGYPWGDQTVFSDVKTLLPGCFLRFRNGALRVDQYFDPSQEHEGGFQSIDHVLEELDRSLKSMHCSHTRLLIPISGGVDSRLLAVRAHALGIPFDSVTITGRIGAQVPNSDFAVARRVCGPLGIRQHIWEWDLHEAVPNVTRLAVLSGGMNSAFFSYPDGMLQWRVISASYDGALRGDETFGWQEFSWSMAHALYVLNVHAHDRLERCTSGVATSSLRNLEATSLLAALYGLPNARIGRRVDEWKQEFYWQTRVPRFIFPVARWQAQYCRLEFPYLTRRFLRQMHNTRSAWRSDKRLIRQALAFISRQFPNLTTIPFAEGPSFRPFDPVENLPPEITRQFAEIIQTPSPLDELVDLRSLRQALKPLCDASQDAAPNPTWSLESRIKIKRRFKVLANLLGAMPKRHVSPTLLAVRLLSLQLYLLNEPQPSSEAP